MGKAILFSAVLVLFAPTVSHAAADYRAPNVRVFDGSSVVEKGTFLAFPKSFRGGASVAAGDGVIVAGAGPGGGPEVRIFSSAGTLLGTFDAYDASYRWGVKVVLCDLDNDGHAEIVTGTNQGGTPHVRTFTQAGQPIFTPGFFAFKKTDTGGISVACGDVDGNGMRDIVVGSGVGQEPSVRVFDRYGKTSDVVITPFAPTDKGGVAVAVANVDGGASSEIVTAIDRFGRSIVKTYRANASRTIIGQFEGWPESVQGGFHLAAGDLDRDGRDEILVSIGNGSTPHVRAFEAYGKALPQNFFAYEQTFLGGVNIAIGDVDGDGEPEIVTAPSRNTVQGSVKYQKYIEVRLDEQRLYAYENGRVVKTFLVSTGIAKYPTPLGMYAVLAKIQKKDYTWTYGPDNPDNYDIKDVEWNLRFAPSLYLHYAFWHNNFGHRMSHGCVNINLENSKWVYGWADVGTPVIIKE